MKTIISRKTKDKSIWKFPTGYGYTMFLFALLLSLIVFSCNKNELIEKNTGKENNMGFHKSGLQIDLTGVDILNGILVFEDSAKYFSIINQLDEACDDYWDYIMEVILTEYGELDEDELNDKLEEHGIHEDQPLIDFEELFFEFYSLRKHLELLELEWLEQEDPTDPDPDDHDIIDETERATYNSLGEIIIGSNIYKVFDDPCGTTIIIKDLDFELLEIIRGLNIQGWDTLRHKNMEFIHECGPDNPEGCDEGKTRVVIKGHYPNTPNYKDGDWLKYKFKYNAAQKYAVWIGVTKNYHKKKKRARNSDVLMCVKNYVPGDCELNADYQNSLDLQKKKKRKRTLPGDANPFCGSKYCKMVIKSGECTATHISGDFQITVALEW
jgi:hypothetical protein